MIRFNLFGFPITVQPFFWLTMALIGGALRADSPEDFLRIALFVIAGFISILVHELGHSLAGRAFGRRSEIILQAFGGVAIFSGRFTRPQSFAVSAAGPAIQIFLGLIVMGAYYQFGSSLTEQASSFLLQLGLISLIWAIFNLLPVLPLDGGQILNAALGPSKIRITLWISIFTAVALAVVGLMYTSFLLLPIFMGYFAWESWKALQEVPRR